MRLPPPQLGAQMPQQGNPRRNLGRPMGPQVNPGRPMGPQVNPGRPTPQLGGGGPMPQPPVQQPPGQAGLGGFDPERIKQLLGGGGGGAMPGFPTSQPPVQQPPGGPMFPPQVNVQQPQVGGSGPMFPPQVNVQQPQVGGSGPMFPPQVNVQQPMGGGGPMFPPQVNVQQPQTGLGQAMGGNTAPPQAQSLFDAYQSQLQGSGGFQNQLNQNQPFGPLQQLQGQQQTQGQMQQLGQGIGSLAPTQSQSTPSVPGGNPGVM